MTPLRRRMLDALVLRGMALRTQESYIDAVARLARHYRRSPDTLNAQQVQQYLLHLLQERHLSRSSVNQYGCARSARRAAAMRGAPSAWPNCSTCRTVTWSSRCRTS